MAFVAALVTGPGAPAAPPGPSWPIAFSVELREPPRGQWERLSPSPDRWRALEAEQHAHFDLVFRSKLLFRADGTIDETVERARLFLTEAGVHQAGNSAFWFDAFDTRATLEHAHTLLPDGRAVAVARKDIVVDPEIDDDVFSGDVEVVLPFRALAPKAISVARISYRHDPQRKPVPWSAIYFPETFVPLERFEVVVEWEVEGVKPEWKTNHPRLVERSLGPRSVSLSLDRAPGLKGDPQRETDDDLLPQLVVAQRSSWRELSSSLAALYEKKASGGALIKQTVAEILGPEDSPRDKAAKIQRFVTGKIRYVGFERGADGVVPRDSQITLERRFGDCKDMTTLFVDLARVAGLEAFPVLTATTRERTSGLLVPSAGYFDHMIACVKIPEERCVDLTATSAEPLTLPSPLAASVRLDLTSGGAEGPTNLPAPQIAWSVRVDIDSEIALDGSVVERGRRSYEGTAAAVQRSQVAGKTREEQLEWARKGLRAAFGETPEPELEIENATESGKPFAVAWRFVRPKVAPLEVPGEWAHYDAFLGFVAQDLRTENKHHASPTSGLRYQGRNRYHLPPNVAPRLWGPAVHYASEFGKLDRVYSADDGVVTVETVLEVPRGRIEVGDLGRFNRFLTAAGGDSRHWFGLAPVGSPR